MIWDRRFTRHDYEMLTKLFTEMKPQTNDELCCAQTLKNAIARCKPVDPEKIKEDIVTLNCTFRLKNLGNGKQFTYSLVFPDDCNGDKENISVLSSIGSEVLGKPVGAIIKTDPRNDQYFIIESVISRPEPAGIRG